MLRVKNPLVLKCEEIRWNLVSMAPKLQQQLKELGSKLKNPPASKDALIKLLKQGATCLSGLEQSPPKSILDSMQPFSNAIAKPELLKHQDREVKLFVAACICEITRITAPEAPYDDDVLKDIFELIVTTFSGLSDTNGPSFGRRVVILETLARYRSCVVMLDLECDDLINEMFNTFLNVASNLIKQSSFEFADLPAKDLRDEHPENVLTSMETIMKVLLEESEDVQENLLITLLSVFGRDKEDVTSAARKLAMSVIEHCSRKLEPGIKQFLVSSMSGDSSALKHGINYHRLLYNIAVHLRFYQELFLILLESYCCALRPVVGLMKNVRKQVFSVVMWHVVLSHQYQLKLSSCLSERLRTNLSDTIEPILSLSLLPSDFSVKDKVTNWIRIFSGFDKVEVKALEKILEQKQRLQQEMQKYLSLRQLTEGGDGGETQKKVIFCFRVMSRCFTDPAEAEENFQILDQLKDSNVWKLLTQLLDPNTSSLQASNFRGELLKILGHKHRLYEFLSALSLKCSYLLFDKDHVKEILIEAGVQKSSGSNELILACMTILVILARFCPLLLGGIEEDLVHLLEDDNEIIKEGTLHILAKAGGTIREQLGVSSRSLDLILERICIEGNRRQAKYAVHALASITKDDGLMSLSVLYKITGDKPPDCWDDRSELCSLKIFGVKALVKSYLPVKDAQLRSGIDGLIELLKNILSFGDISREIESSLVDRAHLKLAAAKAVLRLSKHWEHKILLMSLPYTENFRGGDNFPEVKKLLLNKIHQYVKDRILEPKYACALLLDISSQHPDLEEAKLYSLFRSDYTLTQRQLYLFLSMLVHGEADGKSDVSISKDKETLSLLNSIFLSIRRSEDAFDAAKSKNLYALCDLGMSILKRLAPKQDDLQGSSESVTLPSVLYKPLVKKDENDLLVGEEKTWLADDGILAHFESLELEDNGIVNSVVAEDEIMKDSETEGSELPLGKLMRRLKAKGAKARKEVKNEHSPTGGANENDFDILKMVKEINSDNLGTAGKFGSSNGREYAQKKRSSHKLQKGKTLLSESTDVPVPKRRRTSSALAHKSRPASPSKVSCIGKKSSSSSKQKGKRSAEALNHSLTPKKHNKVTETDSMPSLSSSKSASMKKQKQKSVAGLAKCTTPNNGSSAADLIGCRIKVWWPMDKQFYEGVVKSFDTQKKKHVILYDDGDVEVLRLERERWELIDNGQKSEKRSGSSKGFRPKGRSSGQRNKLIGVSEKDKKLEVKSPSSQVRGKRTPRKSPKQRQKDLLKSDSSMESGESPDVPHPESTTKPMVNDSDSEKEQNARVGKSVSDEELTKKDMKQEEDAEKGSAEAEELKEDEDDSENTQSDNVGGSPLRADASDNEAASSSGEKQLDEAKEESDRETDEADNNDSCQPAALDNPEKKTPASDSLDAEVSDDELLSTWKRRTGKK
ncbi:UNVERIFIED_CONTAM: Sister chromatid cohesion protein PDS5 [Sesamum radiatum]|uniref:Sister chromatid cohesion protein PDS5 n=1 Tax=Sesamum radiatum TaxID=300843 RepID=A0AAW2T1S8_SESRA